MLQEQAYQRLNALKKEQWSKNNMFYGNRGFSRNIRKVRGRAVAVALRHEMLLLAMHSFYSLYSLPRTTVRSGARHLLHGVLLCQPGVLGRCQPHLGSLKPLSVGFVGCKAAA